MQEPTFLILTVLAGESLHGYGIIKAVAALSDDKIALGAGTLYTALERLEKEGVIAAGREEKHAGRVRRYYKLTAAGKHALVAEVTRREGHLLAAKRYLGLQPSRSSSVGSGLAGTEHSE